MHGNFSAQELRIFWRFTKRPNRGGSLAYECRKSMADCRATWLRACPGVPARSERAPWTRLGRSMLQELAGSRPAEETMTALPALPNRRSGFSSVSSARPRAAPGATGSMRAAMRARLTIAQRLGLPECWRACWPAAASSRRGGSLFSDPTIKRLLPGPAYAHRTWRRPRRASRMRSLRSESVAIFGDYDVDGATAAALLCQNTCATAASIRSWHIPDRIFEGYGPNVDANPLVRQSAAFKLN